MKSIKLTKKTLIKLKQIEDQKNDLDQKFADIVSAIIDNSDLQFKLDQKINVSIEGDQLIINEEEEAEEVEEVEELEKV